MFPVNYTNGNCSVTILKDGTKIRQTIDDDFIPEFPESIDLKITDYCDAGCSYCHESSTVRGNHADISIVKSFIDSLPGGMELAIGGGDPLSHPHIKEILSSKKTINNVTVNAVHVSRYSDLINDLRREGNIQGLGVSYINGYESDIEAIQDNNTVLHVISGVHDPSKIISFPNLPKKILILGYKIFGRGVKYNKYAVEKRIDKWKSYIMSFVDSGFIVSFDNLGLEQMKIKSIVGDDVWDKCYMGKEGEFTMYVDLVKMQYAISSTSERFSIGGKNIKQMFSHIREIGGFCVSNC